VVCNGLHCVSIHSKTEWSHLNALICILMTSTETITWSHIWLGKWQNETFVEHVIKAVNREWNIFVIRYTTYDEHALCIHRGSDTLWRQ
jgi:hypothetical protein